MKITITELRRTIQKVIVESKAEQVLKLPRSPSPMSVYHAVMKWMSDKKNPRRDPDAGLIDRVIHNVMVKHQISKDDNAIGQKLNMFRMILDPDLGRRQSYRRGIESEMRDADPTGNKQRYDRMHRSGRPVEW